MGLENTGTRSGLARGTGRSIQSIPKNGVGMVRRQPRRQRRHRRPVVDDGGMRFLQCFDATKTLSSTSGAAILLSHSDEYPLAGGE